jgi:hypothetical protein
MRETLVDRICSALWARLYASLRGWRTKKHIVVLESDDWGSIRVSSREAYERLKARGYALERSQYGWDALETDRDLEMLFEVLDSVRDGTGRPACLTANMVMANPDFQRISECAFEHYRYESVETTLARSPERSKVEALWKEGNEKKLFILQFHAREHIRWWEWLSCLKAGSKETLETFHLGMAGVPFAASKEGRSFYEPLYLHPDTLSRWGVDLESMIREGIQIFRGLFHFEPLSTVAPNLTWSDQAEGIWASLGIRFIQGGFVQSQDSPEGFKRKYHYLGEPGRCGGMYLVRNCSFEPAAAKDDHSSERCLKQIRNAFRLGKPAIVSTHRVNYIGAIDAENRARGLAQLKALLEGICTHWPDVHFLSSPELGVLVENSMKALPGIGDITATP